MKDNIIEARLDKTNKKLSKIKKTYVNSTTRPTEKSRKKPFKFKKRKN